MVDGSAISSRKELGGLNRTAEETADGWMETMAASLHCCVTYLSGTKYTAFPTGSVSMTASVCARGHCRRPPMAADLTTVLSSRCYARATGIHSKNIHRLPFIHPDGPVAVMAGRSCNACASHCAIYSIANIKRPSSALDVPSAPFATAWEPELTLLSSMSSMTDDTDIFAHTGNIL